MKIRNGFVSNSSSSSYIVEIPKDFKVKTNKISEKVVSLLNEAIDIFHNRGNINNGYDIDRSAFWRLIEILEENNFVVMSVDGSGGDGEDDIILFEDQRKK